MFQIEDRQITKIAKIMGSDRIHISLQTVSLDDSFRETNGAAVHDIRRTLPLLTLNNDGITKVFLQLLLRRYVV